VSYGQRGWETYVDDTVLDDDIALHYLGSNIRAHRFTRR